MVEYVRLSSSEKFYGQKVLLRAQLEAINNLNCFENYKKLRSEELVLRVALKTKIEETLETISKLSRMLPRADFSFLEAKKEFRVGMKEKKPSSLIEEVMLIRKKLEQLQENNY